MHPHGESAKRAKAEHLKRPKWSMYGSVWASADGIWRVGWGKLVCEYDCENALYTPINPLKKSANTTCSVFLSGSLCCWNNTITTSVIERRFHLCGVPDRFTAWGMFIIIISQHHFPPRYVQYPYCMYSTKQKCTSILPHQFSSLFLLVL
jgi:hypothetical protein